MSLIFGPRTIAPFVYRNENFSGTLAFMGNDCSFTSTTCQVDSFKSGVPLSGAVATGTVGVGINLAAADSTAVGILTAAGVGSVAIGKGADATVANTIAIGLNATPTALAPLALSVNASGLNGNGDLSVLINGTQRYLKAPTAMLSKIPITAITRPMTAADAPNVYFTGSAAVTMTVQLPDTSTLPLGARFHYFDTTSGTDQVAVQTFTGVALFTLTVGTDRIFYFIDETAGNTAAAWSFGGTDIGW